MNGELRFRSQGERFYEQIDKSGGGAGNRAVFFAFRFCGWKYKTVVTLTNASTRRKLTRKLCSQQKENERT